MREIKFSPEDKYFFFCLKTKTDGFKPGVYHVGINPLVTVTGFTKEAVRIILDRFENYHALLHFDDFTGDITIPDFETGEVPDNPLARKREQAREDLDNHEENFEQIYARYPLKKGKQKAFQRYHKLVTVGCKINGRLVRYTPMMIYKAVVRYVEEYESKNGNDYSYMKHFDTLMNNIGDWMEERSDDV